MTIWGGSAADDYANPDASAPTPESDGFAPYDIDNFWPDLSDEDEGHVINVSPDVATSHPAMPEGVRVLNGTFLNSMRQAYAPAAHRLRLGSASPAPSTIARETVPDEPTNRWGGNDNVWS